MNATAINKKIKGASQHILWETRRMTLPKKQHLRYVLIRKEIWTVMIVTVWMLYINRSVISQFLQTTFQQTIYSMGACICKEKHVATSRRSVRETEGSNLSQGQQSLGQRPVSSSSRRSLPSHSHSRSSSRAGANVDKLVLETLKLIRTLVDK